MDFLYSIVQFHYTINRVIIMDLAEVFKSKIKEMMDTDYRTFIEALISIETGKTNRDELRTLYDTYMDTDDITLLNEFFSK